MNQTFAVEGMTCAACAVSLETYLKASLPIQQIAVNFPNQSVAIDYNPEETPLELIVKKASEIGYTILTGAESQTLESKEARDQKTLKILKKKLVVAAIFTTPIFVISMFFMGQLPFENILLFIAAIPVIAFSGSHFYINAWKRLKHGQSNMDTLVALSTGVAFLYSAYVTFTYNILPLFSGDATLGDASSTHSHLHKSPITDAEYPISAISTHIPHVYFESATVIICLILLGKYLEEKAKQKTASAIRDLLKLQPKIARIIRNGEEIILPISEIIPGDLVKVLPGDTIPVDGKIKSGTSHINESTFTGESIPVSKNKGDLVFASTINLDGNLNILAQKIGSETALARIVQLVENALGTKPKIQEKADKIAGIFTPVVLSIALASALFWWIAGNELLANINHHEFALTTLINVLIIACPCALGLATPTALIVALGQGAKKGILLKDATALEQLNNIDVVVFDKTGTLTEGKPQVVHNHWFTNRVFQHQDEAISLLVQAEKLTNHPLAEAVVKHFEAASPIASNNNAQFLATADKEFQTKTIAGKGISCKIHSNNQDVELFIGSLPWLQDTVAQNILPEQKEIINRYIQEACTLICMFTSTEIMGLIALKDTAKPQAKETIAQLTNQGIECVMITGDAQATAEIIAKELGISRFIAQALPEDKLNAIKQMQAQGKSVAMIGDGINDAPSLAQANIGIAMGTGTQIAMETAQITLRSGDVSQLLHAFNLSKYTFNTINQNLFWAFAYNILAIPIAAGVLTPNFGFVLSPMIAGAAMSLSSITVLSNSLRLKNKLS